MTEITRGTLKGEITPTAFIVTERDTDIMGRYSDYFEWLKQALKSLPKPAYSKDPGRTRSRRLWAFAPGEGQHAQEIAAEARQQAQAIARAAGLDKIPQRLNPPVFFNHVERVDINRYTTYSVRRYDQAALVALIDQVLKALRDSEINWRTRPDPNRVIPELHQLRQDIERGQYSDEVVTRYPVNDLRAMIYIHGEARPKRVSFNNGIFVEGHHDVPVVQPPADSGRMRRIRRDKRTDLPLFTIPTPSGQVSFYVARASTPQAQEDRADF